MHKGLKQAILFFLGLFIYLIPGHSQNVDSVKVEQTGNYIKITFRILNSNKNQAFKVSVLCSVNGGLPGEIKNYSGDAGGNVIGGKSEYMVLWDVFKDVDSINSVEFTVRAELTYGRLTRIRAVNPTGWDKKNFNVLFAFQNHGPKYGCKIGYLGNWGISVEIVNGKMDPERHDFTLSSDSLPTKTYFQLDMVKRILNQKEVQSYFFFGVSANPILFGKSTVLNDYEVRYLAGIHLGFSFAINRIVFYMGTGMMPSIGAIEKKYDQRIISTDTFFDFGLGLRF
jgi:hypothetical protein